MKTDKTIQMLKEVRKNTTDPKMQKDIEAKINKLESGKMIQK